ncbi:MAG: hypothetical protein R3E39_18140 [Anaerolineae bacterium]
MLGVVAFALTNRAVTAQADAPAAPNLQELLSSFKDSKTIVTIEFNIPLITGERVWTLPDQKAKREITAVGADYVCFSEPWNAGARQRCTPFTNIASFTFLTE